MAAKISGEIKTIYSAEDKTGPAGKSVRASMKKAERTSQTVSERMQRQWKGVQRVFKMAAVGIAAAVVGVVYAFKRGMQATLDYGLQIDKFVKQTGLAAEEIQRLRYAAIQEHMDFETLTKIFPILSKYMEYARQGQITYKREFDKMGISVVNMRGELKSTYQVFMEMTRFMATSGVSDTEKLAVAATLLGRRGAEMIPLMKLGRERIEALGKEAEKLGMVLSSQTIVAMKAFDDKLTAIKQGLSGVRNKIAIEVLPYMDKFAGWIQHNMPLLVEMGTEAGQRLIRFTIKFMQYGVAVMVLGERIKVTLGLVREGIAITERKFSQLMNYMSFGLSKWWKQNRDAWESARKQSIQMQKEGMAGMDKYTKMITKLWELLEDPSPAKKVKELADQIKKSGAAGVAAGNDIINSQTGVAGASEKAGIKIVMSAKKTAAEYTRIMEWMHKKEMALMYHGAELKKQQITEEYQKRSMLLWVMKDYIGYFKLQVMLAQELAGIDQVSTKAEQIEAEKKMAEQKKKQLEISRQLLVVEQQLQEQRRQGYREIWAMMMESANLAGGDVGKFTGMLMGGMQGQMDMLMGVDPYAQKLETLAVAYDKEIQLLRQKEASKWRIIYTYSQYEMQRTAYAQAQKYQQYRNSTNMIIGTLGTLLSFVGKNEKAAFALQKAAGMATAIINTREAFTKALAASAPPWNYIQAAAVFASGMAQVKAIAATGFGGASTVGVPSAGGYQYTQPTEPSWEPQAQPEVTQSKIINFHIYGNVVDHDAFAREVIPSIEKALEDGTH